MQYSKFKFDYPEEGGFKGVAFSPDGRLLGVCIPHMERQDEKIRVYTYVGEDN